jgi:sugar transferase (PEP-CTERM/EpsH1 system associated)
MKILFITPYIPTRPRPYELIRYLSRNHEITVVCIVQPTWASRNLEELMPFCKKIYSFDLNRYSCLLRSLAAIPSRTPMSVAYFASTPMKSLITQLVQESDFDLLHTEFIRAAPYTANIQGIPKLYDAVDSLVLAYERGWRNRGGSNYNRIIALEEWIKMRWYEPKMIQAFNRVIVSSPADQRFLTLESGPTVDVIPNGVDYVYFNFNNQERDDNSIVFVGQMNYYVNVDSILYFSNVIFPRIQKQLPNIRFSIVGAEPRKPVQELARNPAIEVTGYVPDLRPYVTKAAVFVCPLLAGSGIQNKLLQAMAMGTPIVTTTIATQALKVTDGVHLVIADEPQRFADAVVSLITNKKLRKELSVNARNYILEHHDWDQIGQKLEIIYRSLLNINLP